MSAKIQIKMDLMCWGFIAVHIRLDPSGMNFGIQRNSPPFYRGERERERKMGNFCWLEQFSNARCTIWPTKNKNKLRVVRLVIAVAAVNGAQY